jgi:hypothetical protein
LVVYDEEAQPQTIRYHLMYALLLKLVQENRKLITKKEQECQQQEEEIARLLAQIAQLKQRYAKIF